MPVSTSSDRWFANRLFNWYQTHRRDLPWRRTRDPYRILVSEVMLQQTQVARVLEKYREFLDRFPTVADLARAPQREVILAWKGLGYNRRALNLRSAAQKVVTDFDGKFPRTKEELLTLPGVGPATVGSLLSFAFGQDEPSLDVNIRRVLHRFFFGSEFPRWRVPDQRIEEVARRTIRKGSGYDWNQGMMDFGSLQCSARRPLCESCPFQSRCQAYPKILEDVKTKRAGWDRVEPAPSSSPEIPNRIFRGRVIEVLRQAARHQIQLGRLGPLVKADFSEDDAAWLRGIVARLATEGFIQLHKKGRNEIVRLV